MRAQPALVAIIWAVVLVGAVVLLWSRRRKGSGRSVRGPGAGAAGAVYDMLNEDKRRAIKIIVDQKAEAISPEAVDGQPNHRTNRRP